MEDIGIRVIEKATKVSTSAIEENKIMQTVPLWWDGNPLGLAQPANYASLLAAYKSWVYICSSRNGRAFASTPLKLYVTKQSTKQKIWVRTKQVDSKVRKWMETQAHFTHLPQVQKAVEILEVPEHPLLDMIYHVNKFMNRFELFDLTDEFQELTGNMYWYIVKNGLGMPMEIWLLSPDRMKVVPSRQNWIMGYVYQTLDGIDIPFTPDEIIHFRFPNPRNPYYGWSPLQAMADSYNINEQMNSYQLNLMKNNAIPSIALIAPKDAIISENQWKDIIRRWNATYGGALNNGKTAWLESGFDVKSLAGTPKELAYLAGSKKTMTELCAAFGVPLSKVTTDAVGRANAESGDYQYMADTIRPRHVLFDERLNEQLVPMVDEQLVFMHDNCVSEDKEFLLKEQESHVSSYITTINEERKKIGMNEVEWGNVPLVSNGVAPLGSQPAVAPGGPPGALPPGTPPNAKDITDMVADMIYEEVQKKRLSLVR